MGRNEDIRLIDADALESYIESDESGLMSAREFELDYIECINEMPTAFDLESVIDTLRKRVEFYEKRFGESENNDIEDWGSIKSYKDCLEIIESAKNGG